jgi:DNA invertase Pin-like site-specific DNA recombinase
MEHGMEARYTTRHDRTHVRRVTKGLWPMAAEPGPDFRWGALLRASKPRRVVLPDGTVKLIEESTDRQDLELIDHIKHNNMGVIVDSYKDVASAWRPGAKRPRYKHALVDLAAGYIDGIACLAVDRLTRRRDQVRPILNAMEEMGGRLFFLWDELDTASDDPDTELRLHELVARAEREAERTSRCYKLAAQHRARRGLHHPSGKRPYGHTEERRQLVDEEAEMLFAAAKAVDQGKAVWAIAEKWTRRGVPTVEGKGRWYAKTLRGMLTSPRMVGKRENEGALIDIEYMPSILPEELWRRVRKKLLENPPKRGRGESRELTNIALCGICDLPLVSQMDRAGPVYICKKRPTEPGACGGIVILVSKLDAKVDEEVVAFLNDKQRAQALLNQHRLETPEMATIDARYAELEDNKLALEQAAFNPPQGVKRLPTERYWELRTEIEREQETLQRRRIVNRDAHPLREALREEWTVEKWGSKPLEWRRAVITLVVQRIEVARVTHRGAVKGRLGAVHNPDRVKLKLAG